MNNDGDSSKYSDIHNDDIDDNNMIMPLSVKFVS
jgi:hypothetical protein